MDRGSLPIRHGVQLDELRYTECWENAAVGQAALSPLPGTRCLSIASAGDNSLDRPQLREGNVEVLSGSLPEASVDGFNPSDVVEYGHAARYEGLLEVVR